MHLVNHGGGCCGIRHIHGMRNRPEELTFADFQGRRLAGYGDNNNNRPAVECLDALLAEFERRENPDPQSRLIEIVLRGAQVNPWRRTLEARGFFEVCNFVNSNTGNECYIFHKYRNSRGYRFRDAQQIPRQDAAVEVCRLYHCVYRDGRRGAGYDTPEGARTANPRARRIDTQVLMSDNSRRWIEGEG